MKKIQDHISFVLIKKKDGYLSLNQEYKNNYVGYEEWVIENKTYYFCRICYTKDNAQNLIKNLGDSGMMQGPDIYAVVEKETNKSVVSVWKPNINGLIEISFYDDQQDGNTALVPEKMNIVQLREEIRKILKVENLKVLRNFDLSGNLYHILKS